MTIFIATYSKLEKVSKLADKFCTSELHLDILKPAIGYIFLRDSEKKESNFFSRNNYFRESMGLRDSPSINYLSEKLRIIPPELLSFSTALEMNNSIEIKKIYGEFYKKSTQLFVNQSQETYEALAQFATKIFQLLSSDYSGDVNFSNEFLDKAANFYLENGYVVIEEAIPAELILSARTELLRIRDIELQNNVAYLYGENNKFQRVYNLLGKSKIFQEILSLPVFNSMMEKFFDRDSYHDKYYLSSFQSNTIFPGAVDQVWHIDANVPAPFPTWPMRVQSALPLDEFTSYNGSTEIVIKSHLLNCQVNDSTPIPSNSIIKILAKPGSVIFWHGALWHRSTANKTIFERNALLVNFSNSLLREVSQEENLLQVLDNVSLNGMSDDILRMLGYYQGIKRGALIKGDLYSS